MKFYKLINVEEMNEMDSDNSHKINERNNTHTQHFSIDPKDVTKFVCRQNENVRVDEDSLTDKDVRVKRSNRGSRSLRGPIEVPVDERL